MSGFPLYDNLIKRTVKKDLTVKQKQQFIKDVKRVDDQGKELIYALIIFYYQQNEASTQGDQLPYRGVSESRNKGRQDLSWIFTDFPIKLRHLLYQFVNMNIKTIEEESSRPAIMPNN